MNIIRSSFLGLAAAFAIIASSPVVAGAATAGSQVYEGLLKHVSTDNIKVYNPTEKKTLSFLIVPHFGNVFTDSGRKQVQMSALTAGQYVKVYYDQKALGAYHADRILIMSSSNMKEGTLHS
jgi:hypothetical protein